MLTSCCSLFSPPKEEGDILKLVINTEHTTISFRNARIIIILQMDLSPSDNHALKTITPLHYYPV